MARLSTVVATLRDPATYREEVEVVDAIETHMSWVFLTGRHAYKLKKPLRTRHLDYTTLSARRRACEREVRLNRRLAPSVYLGVVSVATSEGVLRIDGDGETVDWLVKMRQLPAELMLQTRIKDETVEAGSIDSLAKVLAEFYQSAEPAGLSAATYRSRLESDLESKCRSLRQPHYGLDADLVNEVLRAQKQWLSNQEELIGERAGRVVDAHGDLRPEHVCLEEPPVAIDCLEFDQSLRLLDPVSELSFLGLECRRLGAEWIGERLLERYAEETGDRPPDTLAAFYQTRHAVIRAALAVWHLDDDALDHSKTWRRKARWYLEAAIDLLR